MSDDVASPTPRRAFLGRAAASTIALAASPLLINCAGAAPAATATPTATDDEAWLKPLTGKHKQVFDAPETNEGFPLLFAMAYLNTMTDTYKLQPGEASAFIVARHFGAPMALNDSIWAKYKLGEMFKLNDPQTKKPSLRNYFFNSKEGDLMMIDASADKLMARGVVIGVCNVALTVLSGKAAAAMKLKPEDVLAEWTAGVIPGAHIVPSGVMAVGRAQEHGCSYCFAG